jgi:predicted MarR family transcription regulator
MKKENTSKEIIELFIRMVNKYNALEKIPARHGTRHNLYHSEVSKLEKKGIVRRYKKSTNDKEVFLELTKTGQEVHRQHKEINEQTIKPLDEELSKHSDEEVEFLVTMFKWFDDFLDQSKKKME